MKTCLVTGLLLLSHAAFSQTDSTWLRAFPITDYMVALNDSTVVVQLEMPEGLKLKDKQLGLVSGVYEGAGNKPPQKGFGKCYLIKGVYHYFAIGHNYSGKPLSKGDLLYTLMPKNQSLYYGKIIGLASHFIRLKNVYDDPFYDRYNIFLKWSAQDEKKLLDSLVADIRFTGSYFLENDPSLNVKINSGPYQGSEVLEVMAECQVETLTDFLEYVNARPGLYAGKEWKVSEIMATWLKEGAPTVSKGLNESNKISNLAN